jgi:tetratricopeptide (TPR) repeat protein
LALNKRKVLEAARKFAQKGAKAKALKEYDKLLKDDPRDAKLLLEVGDAYRRWGQNDEAIAQYVKVASQYRQEGFDARAVAVFKQILNLDPKNYGAYVSLSELYQRMGLDSEAAAALQTAADGCHREGRKTEALELLRRMAALDPTNTTSRLKVAELLRQEGMEGEALHEYRAVIEELESQQDREQLITVLERLLEMKSDDVAALARLVRCFMESRDYPRAESLAVRALNVSTDIPQYELLMELYAQMGDDAKLADATRGLAKVYRDRGDEVRARELMQRLPVEEMSSSPRLAVDVSEVEEPEVEDVELLDEDDDFLSLGDGATGFDLRGGAIGEGAELEFDLSDEEPMLDLGLDEEEGPQPLAASTPRPSAPATDNVAEGLPVPEGEPDQLLAEASVYLRYGKRDQAIACLRGILAQEPEHRAALEKLGEAYAEAGRSDEAIALWMRAAEQLRVAGDAGALSVLRDRVAQLDPARAAQIAPLEAPAEADAGLPTLDLDLELALDDELDAGAEPGEGANLLQEREDDDAFEIELEEEDAVAVTDPVVGIRATDDARSASLRDPGDDFEIEVDDLDLDLSVVDDEDVSSDFDFDAGELTSGPDASSADPSTNTTARIDEELEEAEFYIAQAMYDEAEHLIQGILGRVPGHPAALLRMGEIEAARGAVDEGGFEIDVDLDLDAPDDDSETTPTLDVDAGTSSPPMEVELDLGDAADDDDVTEAGIPAAGPTVADDSFDLREALADIFAEEEAPAPDSNAESQVLSTVADGFESIFSDFKKGVTATLEQGDFDTRYDLGIAYREMGLFADAIAEFRFCLDSPDRRFDSLYLMGLCARDLGRFEDAVGHLEQALALPDLPESRMAGVYLDLSIAQEGLGDLERAIASVRRVLALESDFPGASERLAMLQSGATTSPEVGEPGQAFESFDDLFADENDETGDVHVAKQVSAEAFESFDDVRSEAETELVGDESSGEPDALTEVVPETRTEDDATRSARRRAGRKKISFV